MIDKQTGEPAEIEQSYFMPVFTLNQGGRESIVDGAFIRCTTKQPDGTEYPFFPNLPSEQHRTIKTDETMCFNPSKLKLAGDSQH